MTNEEILKAAQSEQENVGEYEKTVISKSLARGAVLGVALCIAMVIFERLVLKTIDFGKPALLSVIAGYSDLYEGRVSNNRKSKIYGIVEMIFALLCFILYIGVLLA